MVGRPTRLVIAAELALLAAALLAAVVLAPEANWDLPLLALLIALSVISDLRAVETAAWRVKISGQSAGDRDGDRAAGRRAGRRGRRQHHPRQLAPLPLRRDGPADQPAGLRHLPADLRGAVPFRDRRPRARAARRQLLPARARPLRDRARDRPRLDRGLQRLSRGIEGQRTPAPLGHPDPSVRARRGAADARGHARAHPPGPAGRDPLRDRAPDLPVPGGRAPPLAGARRRARDAREAARRVPGRAPQRAAPHPRPPRPDDRPAQRRGGAVLARARRARGAFAGGPGAGAHRRPAPRHRQVRPPRRSPEGSRPAQRGRLGADQAPSLRGRPDRLPDRRLHARRATSSWPTTSDSTGSAIPAGSRATRSPGSPGSWRSPMPTTR